MQRKVWDLGEIQVRHHLVKYPDFLQHRAVVEESWVQFHAGLQGAYVFRSEALNCRYELAHTHHNLLYAPRLDLEIENQSLEIETLGIFFKPAFFLSWAVQGNEGLQRMAEAVSQERSTLLSPHWQPNPQAMMLLIREMLHHPYQGPLADMFLRAKCLELLVLQAHAYEKWPGSAPSFNETDTSRLFAARDLLDQQWENPPTLALLARTVGLNEYKLKKGFRQVIGTTVFGYVHQLRMQRAQQLLLSSELTAKEIAYETGYSSPQHFARAFKREFGVSPNRMRKNPAQGAEPQN
ncbi:MAG: AraC family transcriptional regulator [Bacteroidota bacterium]